jgi:hypothetical protein
MAKKESSGTFAKAAKKNGKAKKHPNKKESTKKYRGQG